MTKIDDDTLPLEGSRPVPGQFGSFTWEDLDVWTDAGSIKRGKGYVGNVSDVAITRNDHVIATVSGTDDYATEVWFDDKGLEGRCSCPVGHRCKHAVALVLKCIDFLAGNQSLPLAEEFDDRLAELDEFDEDWDDESGLLDDGGAPASFVPDHLSAMPGDELDAYIDGLDAASAKQMIRELLASDNHLRADWLRRVKTRRGDVSQLLKMARKELKRISREPAWANPWKHESHIPDYSPLRRILEALLGKGAFDELVAFGDSLKTETLPQIEAANDEGDTAGEIRSCMEVVASAVRRSSLTSLEQLRWFADLHGDDDYSTFDGIYDPFVHPDDWSPSDWSAFADSLLASSMEADGKGGDGFFSDYAKKRKLNRACSALRNAGRTDEAKAQRVAWLRRHGEFEDLARFLLDNGEMDAAWDAAMSGLTSRHVRDPYGQLKEQLREILRIIATRRGETRLALALQAEDFFADPSHNAFFSLLGAAKDERLDSAMRPWLVRFLETGLRPGDSPAKLPTTSKLPRKRGRAGSGTVIRKDIPDDSPVPAPSEPWPLVPSGIPLLPDSKHREPGRAILLRIALEEKDPDEILRRWNDVKSQKTSPAFSEQWGSPFSNEVADALAEDHPEESLTIWNHFIEGKLSLVSPYAYREIADAFRKSRPVMEHLGRLGEWENRIRSLQTEYKRRKVFVKELDGLFKEAPAGPTPIIDSRHPRR